MLVWQKRVAARQTRRLDDMRHALTRVALAVPPEAIADAASRDWLTVGPRLAGRIRLLPDEPRGLALVDLVAHALMRLATATRREPA